MTRSEAVTIIEDAADALGQSANELWNQILHELSTPSVAGPHSAYRIILQISDQSSDAAGADADKHEMAGALRDEIIKRAEEGHFSELNVDRLEASYIWARGEKGDVTLDTELTFGKHEGLTLSELFEEDRDYVNWIIKEMKADRPFLATFLAIEEDSRREEEDDTYTFWREDDYLL